MEKNSPPPSNNNKTIVLSLATCALLGIIGFEAFMVKSNHKADAPPAQNYYPYPLELQNEQLKVELNHSRTHLNELKRQLFVRSKAPDSSQLLKQQSELAENNETIETLKRQLITHEQQLEAERIKATNLESSLSTLAEIIEMQKITKGQFDETVQLANSRKEDLTQREETIAKQTQELDELKKLKESLLDSIYESNLVQNDLHDQIAIERTYQKLAASKLHASLATLVETKEWLEDELNSVHSKLELEKRQKDELNSTISALLNQNEEVESELADTYLVADRGAELEDRILIEKTLQALNKERFKQDYMQDLAILEDNFKSLTFTLTDLQKEYSALQNSIGSVDKLKFDKSNVEDALVFEQLTSKLALERVQVELDDLAYALLSLEHQNTVLKQNLEDYLATHEHLKNHLELSSDKFHNNVSTLEAEIAFLKAKIDEEKEQNHTILSEKNAHLESLEHLNSRIALLETSLKEKDSYSEHLKEALFEAETSLEKAALALESLESRQLEENLLSLNSLEIENQKLMTHLAFLESTYIESVEKFTKEKENIQLELSTLTHVKAKQEEYSQHLENTLKEAESSLAAAAVALESVDDHHTSTISQLEAKIHELSSHLANLETTHSSTLESLTTELAKQSASTLDALELENQRLSEEFTRVTAELARLESSNSENIDKLQAELSELLATKSQHENNRQHLEHSLNEAESSLQKALIAMEALEERTSQVSILEHENEQLESKVNELGTLLTHLESSHSEIIDSLAKEKDKVKEEMLEIAKTKLEQEEYVRHLEKSLETAEISLDKSSSALVDLYENTSSNLNSLEEQYKKELAEAIQSVESLNSKIAEYETERGIRESIEAEIKVLTQGKELREQHIAALEISLELTELALETTSQEADLKKLALDEMEQLNHSLSQRISGSEILEKDLQKIHDKYQEALNSIEHLQAEVESKATSENHLNIQGEELKLELAALRSALENEQKQTTEFASQLAVIQEQYLEAESKIHELTAKNEQHATYVQELTEHLLLTQNEKLENESQFEQLADALIKQKEALQALHQQRDELTKTIKDIQKESEEITSTP